MALIFAMGVGAMEIQLQCQTCGESFTARRRNARFCLECQKKRHGQQSQQRDEATKGQCPLCGAAITRRSKYCRDCYRTVPTTRSCNVCGKDFDTLGPEARMCRECKA